MNEKCQGTAHTGWKEDALTPRHKNGRAEKLKDIEVEGETGHARKEIV